MRAGTPSPRYTTALDRLYGIDTPATLQACLIAFQTAVKGSFTLARKDREEAVINAVMGSDKPISQELFEAYANNLRKAVSAVPVSDDLAAQWQANVSRFAAYKAYDATATIRRVVGEDGDIDLGRAVLHTYNRYQAAEYNTAVARARTGKQWIQFSEGDNARLFPNIKWLPSRSATPREEHIPFYNRIWPKNDPFWLTNQPGTLWNCKCDWEQTDDDPTTDNPTRDIVMPGLDQNPATSGQIFTDTAPYFRKASSDVATYAIRTQREAFREAHKEDEIIFNTEIGKVLYDGITVKEITKGAKSDTSYFYKLEIAQHFDKYTHLLKPLPDEAIDLSHNNHNNIFYRRKAQFTKMKVYELTINGYSFRVKLGEYADGSCNLYAITEP